MNEDDFKKSDQDLMEALRGVREKPLPNDALKGFSDQVMREIEQPPFFSGAGMGVSAVMIIAAVLILAGAAWWLSVFLPKEPTKIPAQVQGVQTISQPVLSDNAQVSDAIIHDMMIFSELEVWTEEDEETIGILRDAVAEEIEIGLGESPGTLTGPGAFTGL